MTQETLEAFNDLKMRCMLAPVLAFANFMKPFLLETDASIEGLMLCYLSYRMTISITQSLIPVEDWKEARNHTIPPIPETQVLGTKMDCNWAVQRIPTVSAFPGEDR